MPQHAGAATQADFTQLAGVGPKTAEALVAAGFTTMKELATSSTAALVRELEAVGINVAESKIVSQRWLFQAWERWQDDTAAQSPASGASRSGATSESDSPGGIGAVDDDEQADEFDDDLDDESDGEWEEYASFIVCFDRRSSTDGEQWQTRVWDTKAMAEREIAGTDPGPWIDFIVGQANLPPQR